MSIVIIFSLTFKFNKILQAMISKEKIDKKK